MKRTDIERMDWIKNEHHLQGWYRAEQRATGCTLRGFIIDNRAEIDHAIDSLVGSNGHFGGQLLGVM